MTRCSKCGKELGSGDSDLGSALPVCRECKCAQPLDHACLLTASSNPEEAVLIELRAIRALLEKIAYPPMVLKASGDAIPMVSHPCVVDACPKCGSIDEYKRLTDDPCFVEIVCAKCHNVRRTIRSSEEELYYTGD